MLNIGDKAPEFKLLNQDNIEVSLKDFSSKWVVLYFYPKDNTPGCTTEACDFSQNINEFKDLNAIILGVSPDNSKTHKKFIEKQNLKINLLADENKEVLNYYGVWQSKKMYGREYMGVVRSTFIINTKGEIAYIYKNVKIKGHIEEIKKKLKELS